MTFPRRRILPLLMGVLCLAAVPLAAQTSQPAPGAVSGTGLPARMSWPDFVSALADAMVDPEAGAESLARMLPDDVLIRRFDRTDYDDRTRLHESLFGLTVISTRGYLGVPNSLATDLAADFRNSTRVPDEHKNDMMPDDPAQESRANVTAGQWMASVLEPARAQPVALLVLLREDARPAGNDLTSDAADAGLVFVLLKGEPIGGGQFRVTHIVYGDAAQIAR